MEKINLESFDEEAFVLMGMFERRARGNGWSKAEIDRVIEEAMSSDYSHLLATLLSYSKMGEGE